MLIINSNQSATLDDFSDIDRVGETQELEGFGGGVMGGIKTGRKADEESPNNNTTNNCSSTGTGYSIQHTTPSSRPFQLLGRSSATIVDPARSSTDGRLPTSMFFEVETTGAQQLEEDGVGRGRPVLRTHSTLSPNNNHDGMVQDMEELELMDQLDTESHGDTFGSFGRSACYRQETQHLGPKGEMVYSLLSILGTHNRDDMSRTLLAMSTSPESCLAMRQSGCLPLLVHLLHSSDDGISQNHSDDRATRARAAAALHNIVYATRDDPITGRLEIRVLRLLEQLRAYCDRLRSTDLVTDDGTMFVTGFTELHPGPAIAALMKLSFDEQYRHAICSLGGLQAIAELLHVDQESIGNTDDLYNITMRRYACMSLTNLTFGDGNNKALLCSMSSALRAVVAQLESPSEEICQVAASVLRNLSWHSDLASKRALRDVDSAVSLTLAAMSGVRRESTLKSVLSALWNLSSHSAENKADICSVPGALDFLVGLLTYRSPSKTLSVVENAGGILRNVSSHIAVREDYRDILRRAGCLPTLLRHLRSPSLTVVSNACGTLWNLSARCVEDQTTLLNLGAVAMLKNLVHSRHRMISMGSAAALKNLLTAASSLTDQPMAISQLLESPMLASRSSDSSAASSPTPGLHIRRQRALEVDLSSRNLAETCDNMDSPGNSPPGTLRQPDVRSFSAAPAVAVSNRRIQSPSPMRIASPRMGDGSVGFGSVCRSASYAGFVDAGGSVSDERSRVRGILDRSSRLLLQERPTPRDSGFSGAEIPEGHALRGISSAPMMCSFTSSCDEPSCNTSVAASPSSDISPPSPMVNSIGRGRRFCSGRSFLKNPRVNNTDAAATGSPRSVMHASFLSARSETIHLDDLEMRSSLDAAGASRQCLNQRPMEFPSYNHTDAAATGVISGNSPNHTEMPAGDRWSARERNLDLRLKLGGKETKTAFKPVCDEIDISSPLCVADDDRFFDDGKNNMAKTICDELETLNTAAAVCMQDEPNVEIIDLEKIENDSEEDIESAPRTAICQFTINQKNGEMKTFFTLDSDELNRRLLPFSEDRSTPADGIMTTSAASLPADSTSLEALTGSRQNSDLTVDHQNSTLLDAELVSGPGKILECDGGPAADLSSEADSAKMMESRRSSDTADNYEFCMWDEKKKDCRKEAEEEEEITVLEMAENENDSDDDYVPLYRPARFNLNSTESTVIEGELSLLSAPNQKAAATGLMSVSQYSTSESVGDIMDESFPDIMVGSIVSDQLGIDNELCQMSDSQMEESSLSARKMEDGEDGEEDDDEESFQNDHRISIIEVTGFEDFMFAAESGNDKRSNVTDQLSADNLPPQSIVIEAPCEENGAASFEEGMDNLELGALLEENANRVLVELEKSAVQGRSSTTSDVRLLDDETLSLVSINDDGDSADEDYIDAISSRTYDVNSTSGEAFMFSSSHRSSDSGSRSRSPSPDTTENPVPVIPGRPRIVKPVIGSESGAAGPVKRPDLESPSAAESKGIRGRRKALYSGKPQQQKASSAAAPKTQESTAPKVVRPQKAVVKDANIPSAKTVVVAKPVSRPNSAKSTVTQQSSSAAPKRTSQISVVKPLPAATTSTSTQKGVKNSEPPAVTPGKVIPARKTISNPPPPSATDGKRMKPSDSNNSAATKVTETSTGGSDPGGKGVIVAQRRKLQAAKSAPAGKTENIEDKPTKMAEKESAATNEINTATITIDRSQKKQKQPPAATEDALSLKSADENKSEPSSAPNPPLKQSTFVKDPDLQEGAGDGKRQESLKELNSPTKSLESLDSKKSIVTVKKYPRSTSANSDRSRSTSKQSTVKAAAGSQVTGSKPGSRNGSPCSIRSGGSNGSGATVGSRSSSAISAARRLPRTPMVLPSTAAGRRSSSASGIATPLGAAVKNPVAAARMNYRKPSASPARPTGVARGVTAVAITASKKLEKVENNNSSKKVMESEPKGKVGSVQRNTFILARSSTYDKLAELDPLENKRETESNNSGKTPVKTERGQVERRKSGEVENGAAKRRSKVVEEPAQTKSSSEMKIETTETVVLRKAPRRYVEQADQIQVRRVSPPQSLRYSAVIGQGAGCSVAEITEEMTRRPPDLSINVPAPTNRASTGDGIAASAVPVSAARSAATLPANFPPSAMTSPLAKSPKPRKFGFIGLWRRNRNNSKSDDNALSPPVMDDNLVTPSTASSTSPQPTFPPTPKKSPLESPLKRKGFSWWRRGGSRGTEKPEKNLASSAASGAKSKIPSAFGPAKNPRAGNTELSANAISDGRTRSTTWQFFDRDAAAARDLASRTLTGNPAGNSMDHPAASCRAAIVSPFNYRPAVSDGIVDALQVVSNCGVELPSGQEPRTKTAMLIERRMQRARMTAGISKDDGTSNMTSEKPIGDVDSSGMKIFTKQEKLNNCNLLVTTV